jgi:hypothetical protein
MYLLMYNEFIIFFNYESTIFWQNWVCLPIYSYVLLKSEVAIASLFCQTKQPKTFLLQLKTITKSPGIGIAESVKSCNLHQKGSFKA